MQRRLASIALACSTLACGAPSPRAAASPLSPSSYASVVAEPPPTPTLPATADEPAPPNELAVHCAKLQRALLRSLSETAAWPKPPPPEACLRVAELRRTPLRALAGHRVRVVGYFARGGLLEDSATSYRTLFARPDERLSTSALVHLRAGRWEPEVAYARGTSQFASEPTCDAVLAEIDGVLKEELRPRDGPPFCDALPCPPNPPPSPKVRELTLEDWGVHRLLARREDASCGNDVK